MKQLRYVLVMLFVAAATVLGYRLYPRPVPVVVQTPPLVDTLTGVFENLHQAMLAADQDRFFGLLDPQEGAKLKVAVRKNGYGSLKTFIERQFANWPDFDTLNLYEIRQAGPYARLTFSAPGTRFGFKEPRTRYTYLLFKRLQGSWRIAAVTDMECDRFDPYGYGYRLSFHETDLPPKLRFPRAF